MPDSTRPSKAANPFPFTRAKRTPPTALIDTEGQVDMRRLRK